MNKELKAEALRVLREAIDKTGVKYKTTFDSANQCFEVEATIDQEYVDWDITLENAIRKSGIVGLGFFYYWEGLKIVICQQK